MILNVLYVLNVCVVSILGVKFSEKCSVLHDQNTLQKPDNALYGVIRHRQHCPNLMAGENYSPICNYPICNDFVCCPPSSSSAMNNTREDKTCLQVDDAENIMKSLLRYESDCVVHGSTGVKGVYVQYDKQGCPALNGTDINEISKACEYDFCSNWICCPTQNWTEAPRRTFDDSTYRHLDIRGDICVDALTGSSGICRPQSHCPKVRDQKYKNPAGLGYNWTICGFTECSEIVCCPEPNMSSLANYQTHCYQNLNTRYDRIIKLPPLQPMRNKVAYCVAASSISGQYVWPKEYSHMAAIGYAKNGSITYNCSGAIISQNFVVTAEACRNATIVRVGSLGDYEPEFPGNDCPQSYDIDEEFVQDNLRLLKLKQLIKFNTLVRPICLPMHSNWPQYATILTYEKLEDSTGLGKLSKLSRMIHYDDDNEWRFSANGNYNWNLAKLTPGDPLHFDNHGEEHLMSTLIGIATDLNRKDGVVFTKTWPYIQWINEIVFH